MTYNLDLDIIQRIMELQVRSGYGMRYRCFRDAELPGVLGTGGTEESTSLFELLLSAW